MYALNIRIIKTLDLKLKLQASNRVDEWKKSVEEFIKDDPEAKGLLVIESLRIDNSKLSNTIEKREGAIPFKEWKDWKDKAVNIAYDLIKADTELVAKALG